MRDLLADLELCNKATPGPWRHECNPDYSEVYAPGVDNPIILVGHDPYDADFIVQAREGWPHAIERAIKAESTLRELVEALERSPHYATKEALTLSEWAMRENELERVYVEAKEVLDHGNA